MRATRDLLKRLFPYRSCTKEITGKDPPARGGTVILGQIGSDAVEGPARARGNQSGNLATLTAAGSIPARAGEPVSGAVTSRLPPVYPRACGGTPPDQPAT